MATVKFKGETFSCVTALKGEDYVHLLDSDGCMVAAFDGISDFSVFEIEGEWTDPTDANHCNIATIGEDGVIKRSNGKLCDAAFFISTPKYPVKKMSEFAAGDVVKLKETDGFYDYIVITHDYESGLNGAGRTLLWRKTVLPDSSAWSTNGSGYYNGSTIDTLLQTTFKNRFSEELQAQIGTTKIKAINSASTVETLSRFAFLLAWVEAVSTGGGNPRNLEGSYYQIAATNAGVSGYSCWLRTWNTATNAQIVSSAGTGNNAAKSSIRAVRPAITLPADFEFITDGTTYYEEQEYETAIGDINGTPFKSKIATGSYTGTGTYGSYQTGYNKLTFDFEAKIVLIGQKTRNFNDGISGRGVTFVRGMEENWEQTVQSAPRYRFVGNRVDWCASSAATQYNENGVQYTYVAIG